MELLQSIDETKEIYDFRLVSYPVERRCDATKVKVPKLQSASSVDGMVLRCTRAVVHKESAEASQTSNCCARREASDIQ